MRLSIPIDWKVMLFSVADSAPVQNQAAAQKLLQKMNQQGMHNQHLKGRKHRGKGKQKEGPVFTLDEWEQRNAVAKLPNMRHDEELARQLQSQFDLEDAHHVSIFSSSGAVVYSICKI